jgi:16S rRNA (cytosine1402-N4)-methyltransferase
MEHLMRHNIAEAADPGYAHMPVMWREVLDFVEQSPREGRGYLVDCTLGEGGHSAMLLERCPGLAVIGIERDPEILEIARERLARFGERVRFIHDNFSNLARSLGDGPPELHYFLYDLGVSSFHFDRSGRGFSYAGDERLDMRLDETGETAFDVVNRYDQRLLADIFHKLGEERWSRRIAAAICRERENRPVETSGELAAIVMRAVPRPRKEQGIHPATRVFQALRIQVNDELSAIAGSIRDAWMRLASGGRIIAIAFHSLEDREVKTVFRQMAKGCSCGGYPEHCRCNGDSMVKILTKKPLVPQHDEMEYNRRARSAKMRACEKIRSGPEGGE